MHASPRRRADARRSRAAILDAAVRLLDDRPDASVENVATAAGVTRQTVYAHFPSRAHLLAAVLDRVTEEAVAAMDAADLDSGSAADALLRLVEAGSRSADRYPRLMHAVGSHPADPRADAERHAPVTDRLGRVVRRGQTNGEFDAALPADWLVAVVVALGHAAAAEEDAGRLSGEEAAEALRCTLLRALGHRPLRPSSAGGDRFPGAAEPAGGDH
ncbi:TetR/AcrR family transcriptional regulator [Nocardiopsis sp. HUAS JQ3]|uniref:TetR/AcrR family transcriptional regulator n=1 Tax=Nocardiopsis sp. HUAS JQ3 TaxID=3061629 RepID=UPI0023A9AB66|nr:TetR/AcrR family transcriptional regulator [Nocardiopsis sp. HUAS JQ3]WDZ91793.1 TetR/AcrR family transcriptional regulator [Nocardiopsis sp. HUAS JQ3]